MSCQASRRTPLTLIICAAVSIAAAAAVSAQGDLDALMRQVLERRDQNWTKLQQYVLDEREHVDAHGPTGALIWGERREYTWYIRDGFFVRSPVRVNGAPVSERDRQAYEADFLRRLTERERRRARASGGQPEPLENDASDADIAGLMQRNRQPQFISTAYFLRFRFEGGRYAFVGREMVEGQEALKIEYYPTSLFRDPRRGPGDRRPDDPGDRETRRLMNKVSLVTLWIEPKAQQILKYTFDNVSTDFLPTQWLARVRDVSATMIMGQPFPDVWLPKSIDVSASGTLAIGQFDIQYGVEYYDYRQADVGSKVVVPDAR